MVRFALVWLGLLMTLGPVAAAQETLGNAISAAMGEAMAEARYGALLTRYGLPLPNIAADQVLASTSRNRYPERLPGTLLDNALKTGKLRIGWIRVGIPFSFVGSDGALTGLAIELWPLILEKLSAQYGSKLEPVFVEFTVSTGNNDMYQQLASDDDHACVARKLASPDMCYDVIGGAYAFNEPRKKVSALTAAYYPLNMSGTRTPRPLAGKDGKEIVINSPESFIAAAGNPDAGLVVAALAATGETQFLAGLKARLGDNFKVVMRPAESNLLEFAQSTEAHIVLSTNVRNYFTRSRTPQFCTSCPIIEGLQPFDGVGFATALSNK